MDFFGNLFGSEGEAPRFDENEDEAKKRQREEGSEGFQFDFEPMSPKAVRVEEVIREEPESEIQIPYGDCDPIRRNQPENTIFLPLPLLFNTTPSTEACKWLNDTSKIDENNFDLEGIKLIRGFWRHWIYIVPRLEDDDRIGQKAESGYLIWDPFLLLTEALCVEGDNIKNFVKRLEEISNNAVLRKFHPYVTSTSICLAEIEQGGRGKGKGRKGGGRWEKYMSINPYTRRGSDFESTQAKNSAQILIPFVKPLSENDDTKIQVDPDYNKIYKARKKKLESEGYANIPKYYYVEMDPQIEPPSKSQKYTNTRLVKEVENTTEQFLRNLDDLNVENFDAKLYKNLRFLRKKRDRWILWIRHNLETFSECDNFWNLAKQAMIYLRSFDEDERPGVVGAGGIERKSIKQNKYARRLRTYDERFFWQTNKKINDECVERLQEPEDEEEKEIREKKKKLESERKSLARQQTGATKRTQQTKVHEKLRKFIRQFYPRDENDNILYLPYNEEDDDDPINNDFKNIAFHADDNPVIKLILETRAKNRSFPEAASGIDEELIPVAFETMRTILTYLEPSPTGEHITNDRVSNVINTIFGIPIIYDPGHFNLPKYGVDNPKLYEQWEKERAEQLEILRYGPEQIQEIQEKRAKLEKEAEKVIKQIKKQQQEEKEEAKEAPPKKSKPKATTSRQVAKQIEQIQKVQYKPPPSDTSNWPFLLSMANEDPKLIGNTLQIKYVRSYGARQSADPNDAFYIICDDYQGGFRPNVFESTVLGGDFGDSLIFPNGKRVRPEDGKVLSSESSIFQNPYKRDNYHRTCRISYTPVQ